MSEKKKRSSQLGFWVSRNCKIKHIGYESGPVFQTKKTPLLHWYCNKEAKKIGYRFYTATEEPSQARLCKRCYDLLQHWLYESVYPLRISMSYLLESELRKRGVVMTPIEWDTGCYGIYSDCGSMDILQESDRKNRRESWYGSISIPYDTNCVQVEFTANKQVFTENIQVYDIERLSYCGSIPVKDPCVVASYSLDERMRTGINEHVVDSLIDQFFSHDVEFWQKECEDVLFET